MTLLAYSGISDPRLCRSQTKRACSVSLRPRATPGDHFTYCCTCAAASERLADCLLTESGIFVASCELPAALGSSLRIPLPLKRLSAPLLEPLGSLQRAPLTCLESSRLQKDLTTPFSLRAYGFLHRRR